MPRIEYGFDTVFNHIAPPPYPHLKLSRDEDFYNFIEIYPKNTKKKKDSMLLPKPADKLAEQTAEFIGNNINDKITKLKLVCNKN